MAVGSVPLVLEVVRWLQKYENGFMNMTGALVCLLWDYGLEYGAVSVFRGSIGH